MESALGGRSRRRWLRDRRDECERHFVCAATAKLISCRTSSSFTYKTPPPQPRPCCSWHHSNSRRRRRRRLRVHRGGRRNPRSIAALCHQDVRYVPPLYISVPCGTPLFLSHRTSAANCRRETNYRHFRRRARLDRLTGGRNECHRTRRGYLAARTSDDAGVRDLCGV